VIKHIDLIAVGALLCGIALYSQARDSSILQVIPHQRIALVQAIQDAVKCSRTAHAGKSVRLLVAPQIRVLPRVTVTTD
jgi:hypothetical protein